MPDEKYCGSDESVEKVAYKKTFETRLQWVNHKGKHECKAKNFPTFRSN